MYHGRHIGCDGGDCVAGGDVKKKIMQEMRRKRRVCRASTPSTSVLLRQRWWYCTACPGTCHLPDGIRVCTTINRTHTCSIIIQTRALHEYSSVNYHDDTVHYSTLWLPVVYGTWYEKVRRRSKTLHYPHLDLNLLRPLGIPNEIMKIFLFSFGTLTQGPNVIFIVIRSNLRSRSSKLEHL